MQLTVKRVVAGLCLLLAILVATDVVDLWFPALGWLVAAIAVDLFP